MQRTADFVTIVRRIYLNQPLTTKQTIPLTLESFHYAVRVLRIRDGQKLTVFNGDGNDYTATLQMTGKKSANICITAQVANTNESPLHLTVIQGLSKGERMDTVMQKAVELGVNNIIPIRTEFCAVKLEGERLQKKQQHWQAIMTSACEQSERAVVPILRPLMSFADAIHTVQADIKWLLHPYPLMQEDTMSITPQRVAILIGPEGGFSDSEIKQAITQKFIPKTLGRRILRTETATIAALSICQQQWGDWHV